jgi:hypothetical protein
LNAGFVILRFVDIVTVPSACVVVGGEQMSMPQMYAGWFASGAPVSSTIFAVTDFVPTTGVSPPPYVIAGGHAVEPPAPEPLLEEPAVMPLELVVLALVLAWLVVDELAPPVPAPELEEHPNAPSTAQHAPDTRRSGDERRTRIERGRGSIARKGSASRLARSTASAIRSRS